MFSKKCIRLDFTFWKYFQDKGNVFCSLFLASQSKSRHPFPIFDSTLYLNKTFLFPEEAMSAQCGVLVHCVAGVSRSVTVTLAYLMQRHRLCLRDAFELVRSRKTDISPNFHFMRQLHSFERDLGLHDHSASLSKVWLYYTHAINTLGQSDAVGIVRSRNTDFMRHSEQELGSTTNAF